MGKRLLLGPIMIVLMLLGLWADAVLDQTKMPSWAARVIEVWNTPWFSSVSQVNTPSQVGEDGTYPPGLIVFVFVLGLSVLAARELASILIDKSIEASKRVLTFAAVIGLFVSCLVPRWMGAADTVAIVSMSALLVLVLAIVVISRHKSVEGVIAGAGGALLSFVYLGLMFGFLLAIRREHSAWALLWVLAVTKSCDIGAYFTGVAIGRHKLIPWLSPGKTWEGLAGGVVVACIVAYLGWAWMEQAMGVRSGVGGWPPWWQGVVPGVCFALIGQAGDLLESALKRDAGIKDSGRSIPGFGGILDVIDSPLCVGAFAFWWLRMMEG